jgi:pantothenate kinase type III
MMLRLLGKGADQLPEIDADDLLELPKLPGKNTEEAMTCGAAFALVGGVSLLIANYRTQYGSEVPVILSGGDGMRLAPYIPQPLIVRPHLVHRGLLKLAELNSKV